MVCTGQYILQAEYGCDANLKVREAMGAMQSPDSAKVKEELARLGKRLRAGQKGVQDAERKQGEQASQVAKLKSDLEHIADGGAPCVVILACRACH